MKLLVTGGAGYIGSTAVPHLLASGHRVRVLDSLLHGGSPLLGVWNHPGFEFLRGDLRDGALLASAMEGVEAVIHLAAIVGDPACARQPELTRAVNLEASLALLEMARRARIQRLIFASTCSNYGEVADAGQFVDEQSGLNPLSLYAETKVAVERAILETPDWPFAATVLRFATIFGVSPRLRFDLIVNEFAVKMIDSRRLVVFGKDVWRPFVHVLDAARAIAAVLDARPAAVSGQVFNVGATAQNYQKQQIVEMIRPHAPEADVEYVESGLDRRNYRVSFARFSEGFGFRCSRSVQEGIAEFARLVESGIVADYDSPEFHN